MLLGYLLEYNRYMNLIGIFFILLISFCFSHNRKKINYRLIISSLIMQVIIALFVLKIPAGKKVVEMIAHGVTRIYQFADVGAAFVFGSLINEQGPWGFIFAFKVVPVMIFFSAFTALLFHFYIIQYLVLLVNYCIRPFLKTSGAETLCAVANSFLGQTESPLLIRNYLSDMTKSELLVVMLSGMATISGSILVVFSAMGIPVTHMLAASLMSIPGSIMMAKILYPETEKPITSENKAITFERTQGNVFDSISAGTSDGLMLALNVVAMLIAFLALLAFGNSLLNLIPTFLNTLLPQAWQLPEITLASLFAYIFAPLGYLLGFSGSEALAAGQLLGIKVAVNEFIAYSEMLKMHLSSRTIDILTYALCGFSNFSCIGIQIGGIGALAPNQRKMITQLGLYAVMGAACSNVLTAMIASLLL